jgi:alkylation response protein AidB-like acyl-CoA dehydrogenase
VGFEYELSAEHIKLKEVIRDFGSKVVLPLAAKYDKSEETPWDILKEAAKQGIYHPNFFSTLMADPTGVSALVVAEELASFDAGVALSILYPALPLTAVALTATDEEKSGIIPSILGDKDFPKVISFAASEKGAGSDVSRYETTAVKSGDGWVINGSKRWAGNAVDASVFFVVAQVDKELGSKGQALFMIPRESQGVLVGEQFTKLGLRCMTHADITFNNVTLPAEGLVGGLDKLERRLVNARNSVGSALALQTFEATRPLVAAMAVGVARGAHEVALRYAKEREVFGKSIGEHQQIAAILADQRTKIDAARLMAYRAADMQAKGLPMLAKEGSMAKLFAAEVVRDVTSSAISIAGGIGFTGMLSLERAYRDAPIFGIFEGTDQIQRLLIASALLKRRIR